MISIKDLNLREYDINIDIEPNSLIGFYGRKKNIIHEFLLIIAGINRSKEKCFYNGKDLYDRIEYFKERIYLNCADGNLQTLQADQIVSSIQGNFQKTINKDSLKEHIKKLAVRGECEITNNYKYIFSDAGNTLANIAIVLSSKEHLILNNPTINLTRQKDIEYIFKELKTRSKITVLGFNKLEHVHRCDQVYIFNDFNELIKVDPFNDTFIVVDACDDVDEYRVFKLNDEQWIIKNIPKDLLKKCSKNNIEYAKVKFHEIEKYIQD